MRIIRELREACSGLPGSIETFPFDRFPTTLVFKVGAQLPAQEVRRDAWRMYALTDLRGDPLRLSLKCDPARSERLRAEFAAVTPGYHLNKRHWNTLTLDGTVPDELVRELLLHSYDLVRAALPGAVRAAVGAR